jgi:hypothetical protein
MRKSVVAEEIHTIKKKSSALHQDNRKDASRAFQELVGTHLCQDKGYKGVD